MTIFSLHNTMRLYLLALTLVVITMTPCYAIDSTTARAPHQPTPAIRNTTGCRAPDDLDPPRKSYHEIQNGGDIRHKTVLFVINHYSSHLFESAKLGKALVDQGVLVYMLLDFEYPRGFLKDTGIKLLTYRVNNRQHGTLWDRKNQELLLNHVFYPQYSFLENAEIIITKQSEIISEACQAMMEDSILFSTLAKLRVDMVVHDILGYSTCLELVASRLQVPALGVSTFLLPWNHRLPVHPVLYPFPTLPFTPEMTLTNKIINIALHFRFMLFVDYHHRMDLLEKYAPQFSSYKDLVRSTTKFTVQTREPLLEYNLISTLNHRNLPSLLYEPGKPLAAEYELIFNSSRARKYGVIIQSFGSTMKLLPKELIQRLYRGLSKVKQEVIVSGIEIEGVEIPSNIHLFPWIPQNDLLARNGSVLFITHGGNNGQYESVYHGIPMITMPLFLDQQSNGQRIKYKGLGEVLDASSFTADQLAETCDYVISTKSYSENVRKLSQVLKKRRITPTEEFRNIILDGLEFGFDHLQTAKSSMSDFEFLMFDIIGAVAVLVALTSALLTLAARKLLPVVVGHLRQSPASSSIQSALAPAKSKIT